MRVDKRISEIPLCNICLYFRNTACIVKNWKNKKICLPICSSLSCQKCYLKCSFCDAFSVKYEMGVNLVNSMLYICTSKKCSKFICRFCIDDNKLCKKLNDRIYCNTCLIDKLYKSYNLYNKIGRHNIITEIFGKRSNGTMAKYIKIYLDEYSGYYPAG